MAVALGFACMMRGSSVVGLRAGDVSSDTPVLHVVEAVRKGHTHGDPVLRRLSIDCTAFGPLRCGVQHWQILQEEAFAAVGGQTTHFFQLPGETLTRGDPFASWFRLAVAQAAVGVPQGRHLHPHCVRKGAASAARALGLRLEQICRLGGWALGSRSVWRHIDPLVQPSRSAFMFFGHLLPPALRVSFAPGS